MSATADASGLAVTVMELVGLSMLLGINYFVSRLVDPGRPQALGAFRDTGYFSFVVPGLAISGLLGHAVRGVLSEFRQGQLTGTLETLFMTPAAHWELIVWGAVWNQCRALLRVVLVLVLATAMGFSLPQASWTAALLVVITAGLAFIPFAIASAAWVLFTRRTQPIPMLVAMASAFIGGVYFPVELLPRSVAWLSELYPLTHALRAFRGALIDGAEVRDGVLALVLWTIFATPVSLVLFEYSVRTAKRNGTLAHY